jgi:hypothetical protein
MSRARSSITVCAWARVFAAFARYWAARLPGGSPFFCGIWPLHPLQKNHGRYQRRSLTESRICAVPACHARRDACGHLAVVAGTPFGWLGGPVRSKAAGGGACCTPTIAQAGEPAKRPVSRINRRLAPATPNVCARRRPINVAARKVSVAKPDRSVTGCQSLGTGPLRVQRTVATVGAP